MKPLHLSFGIKSNASSGPALDAESARLVQFVVDEVNGRRLADSVEQDDSREQDDSKESLEFDGDDSDDGYYQLVRVHQLAQMVRVN